MAICVLDTHALLWWTLDPEQLSAAARDVCTRMESDGALVSSISLWELGLNVKRGQLVLPLDLASYVARLQRLSWLEIVAVDAELWLRNLALQWEHRDPADRTIVATAQRYDLPLVSKDKVVAAFYARTVW